MPAVAAAVDLCAVPGLSLIGCLDRVDNPIGGIVGSLGASMLSSIADAFFRGWWLFQARALTFWTEAPTPSPADLLAPGSTHRWVAWVAQFVLIISILISAGRTILTRDGRNLLDAARTLVLTILTFALVVTVAATLVAAGDAIAEGLLGDALAEGFAADPQPVGAALMAAGGAPGVILIAIIGFLASIVQFFILLSRNAVLPVVIVLLPLAAAAGGSQVGRAWFGRMAAWLLALALYKPIAAIIYSVVLVQARTSTSAMTALTALVGMCMAIFALPALIKLFSPSPAGGGTGGGGYAGGLAVGSVVRATAARG